MFYEYLGNKLGCLFPLFLTFFLSTAVRTNQTEWLYLNTVNKVNKFNNTHSLSLLLKLNILDLFVSCRFPRSTNSSDGIERVENVFAHMQIEGVTSRLIKVIRGFCELWPQGIE